MKFDHYLYENIGAQLREAREKKQLSLQQVSDRINGYKTKQTIMRYEKGEVRIDEEAFEKICSVLGLDPTQVVANAKGAKAAEYDREASKTVDLFNDLHRLLLNNGFNDSQFKTVFSYLHLYVEDQAIVDVLVKTLTEKKLQQKYNEAMNTPKDPFFSAFEADREV